MPGASVVPQLERLTPVLVVEEVEPCVRFWTERFGFASEDPVKGPDGKWVFAIAKKDAIEVMYQTRASVVADMPALAKEMNGRSAVLYIRVKSIDAVEGALAGAPVVKARHKTFYGSTEIYVREPGGHVVGFGQF
ncbi:MAG TPA: hypothetical protein VEH62_10825 [Gemmatimonadales bacterium]|nr:hypothetical protein [Gemmatimonadales bacterium]